jgi:hypothetical protein
VVLAGAIAKRLGRQATLCQKTEDSESPARGAANQDKEMEWESAETFD